MINDNRQILNGKKICKGRAASCSGNTKPQYQGREAVGKAEQIGKRQFVFIGWQNVLASKLSASLVRRHENLFIRARHSELARLTFDHFRIGFQTFNFFLNHRILIR